MASSTPMGPSGIQANLRDPLWRVQNLYLVIDKERRRRRPRFKPSQLRIAEAIKGRLQAGQPIRHYDLKCRQSMVTTFWMLLYLDNSIFTPNTRSVILANKKETLDLIWSAVRFAHASMPDSLRPRLAEDSAKTLAFQGTGSKVMVALKVQGGTVNNLHVSEYPLCDSKDIEQTIAACPPSANITLEGVAEGMNHAFDKWNAGRDGYTRLFHPWFLQVEYRDPEPVPDGEWTGEELRLAELALREYGVRLDGFQVAFRRRMKRELRQTFQQEYAADPVSCFVASGSAFFDGDKLGRMKLWAGESQPAASGDGWMQWEAPTPGHWYAAGADIADGVRNEEGDPDYSVLTVICVHCRRVAFRFRARVGHDTFAALCDEWGRRYNHALLAPENNSRGAAVIVLLRDLHRYPNLYHEDPVWAAVTFGQKAPKRDPIPGWETGQANKPVMLLQLKELIEGKSEADASNFTPEITTHDPEFLAEALSFRGEGRKLQAASGKHDDCVMSMAIAAQMYLVRKKELASGESGGILVNESESSRLFG